MQGRSYTSFLTGFLILFIIYHLPEFFNEFWLMAVCKIGILPVAFMIARAQGWAGLGGFGLSIKNKWLFTIVAGLFTGLIAFTLAILATIKLGYGVIDKIEPIQFFIQQVPMILLMTFFPSMAEDILTRGYLFGHLKQLRPFVWIIISAIIYVLNHIWRLDDGLPVLTYLFVLGIVLAFCVAIKKSLWLAFGIHWGANIAFELSGAGIKLTTREYPDVSNWMLAAVWALLFVILFFVYRKTLSDNNYEKNK